MRVAAVIEGFDPEYGSLVPWLFHREHLGARGVHIDLLHAAEGFRDRYDAMIPMVWLDWDNPRRFIPRQIMPFLEKYSEYRSRFPDVVQIICNHIDMARRPYATPYWRKGDPILYRTPPYDRKKLDPFPDADIWPYECIMGTPCFVSGQSPKHHAGFIGTPSGSKGYRARVARETAKVGIGICSPFPIPREEYWASLRECAIIVCPSGWGEQSARHWDAWKSGKPVLTDQDCAAVEMIPGVQLEEGVHYLVFRDPAEIPDIVADWTRSSRRDELGTIAENGMRAAYSYDPLDSMTRFFRSVASRIVDLQASKHQDGVSARQPVAPRGSAAP